LLIFLRSEIPKLMQLFSTLMKLLDLSFELINRCAFRDLNPCPSP